MKIKRVSLDQYAGVNGINKTFEPELNIVIGNNESGKSTLIDFIYNSLFRHARTKGKEDEEFTNKCYPKKADGSEPATIEGTLEIDIDGKEYKISKVWSKKEKLASTKLVKPAGIVNGDEAENEISELIDYGAGLYRSTVFSSQRDAHFVSEYLLDDSGKKSGALVSDLSQVLSDAAQEQTDIPSSKIAEKIGSCLDDYCMGWDIENDAPATKGEKGEIRQLYKQYVAIEKEIAEIESYEKDYESVMAQLTKAKEDREEIVRLIGEYNKNADLIKEKEEKTNKSDKIGEQLSKDEIVYGEWPTIENKCKRAVELRSQLKDAKIVSRFIEVEELKDAHECAKHALDEATKVEESDIEFLETLEKRRKEQESLLGGMNINVDIIKLDEQAAKFSYSDNGEEIAVKENMILEPKRPLKVDVSDKLELQIRPTGIDPADVMKEISNIKKDFEAKCNELGCNTIERAKDLKKQYEVYKFAYESSEQGYKSSLEKYKTTWAALKELRDSVESDLEEDAVAAHFPEVDCSDEEGLNKNISDWEAKISLYKSMYNSVDELKEKIENQKKEKKELDDRINEIGDIEGEDGNNLKERLTAKEKEIETITTEQLPAARAKLIDKKSLAQYRSELEEIGHDLEEAKKMGKRWYDILKKFNDVKANASKIDVTVLKNSFVDYMQKLTGGSIDVEDLSSSMELKMKSGSNQLADGILSDGTRETIELAFRLAMIDEIFPKGGGFAVFDDPLVNMDPERTERSCKLLKEFAKKNQVIFITCHPELISIFGEKEINKIEMP